MFIGTFLVFTLIVVLSGGSGLAQLLMNHEQRSEKTHEKALNKRNKWLVMSDSGTRSTKRSQELYER